MRGSSWIDYYTPLMAWQHLRRRSCHAGFRPSPFVAYFALSMHARTCFTPLLIRRAPRRALMMPPSAALLDTCKCRAAEAATDNSSLARFSTIA